MNRKLIVAALLTAVSGAVFVAPTVARAEVQEPEKWYCDYPLVKPEFLPEENDCINVMPAGDPYVS